MLREKTFVPLTHDLLFKEAMSHKDNREQLIDFLKVVINLNEEVITNNLVVRYESVLNKTRLDDKSMAGDIIIEFDKYIVNLESYTKFNRKLLEKSTSYVMRVFSTQLDRGVDYNNLVSVIQINIIDDVNMKINDEFKSEYAIVNVNDVKDVLIADKFKIKYYRIDKVKEDDCDNSRETKWIKFIGAKSREERLSIAKGDKLLMKLDKWVEEYINDEKTIKLFSEWGEHIARELGIEEGIEKGKKHSSLEIAKKLKEKNYDMNVIIELTGLSKEEINKS